MSRIINSDTPSQQRTKLLKLIANVVHILEENNSILGDLNDLIAFIVLSLMEIEKTINKTTAPWEKREYWVKADQFRREWKWVGENIKILLSSRTSAGWDNIPLEIGVLKDKLKDINIPRKFKDNRYWLGAFAVLLKK